MADYRALCKTFVTDSDKIGMGSTRGGVAASIEDDSWFFLNWECAYVLYELLRLSLFKSDGNQRPELTRTLRKAKKDKLLRLENLWKIGV